MPVYLLKDRKGEGRWSIGLAGGKGREEYAEGGRNFLSADGLLP